MAESLKILIAQTKTAVEGRAALLRADAATMTEPVSKLVLESYARKFDARARDCARWQEEADSFEPARRQGDPQALRRASESLR